MNLRRILPIAVGAAVVVAVGAYVMLGEQQAGTEAAPRARVPGSGRAGAGRVARRPPTCRSISTPSAPSRRSTPSRCARRSTGRSSRSRSAKGRTSRSGDVLAEIDPRTYQAQLDQAVAKKAQDEATLANARIDLERYTKLVASNSGSKQQADTQKALVAQLEAQVQADQAAIDNARTMLSYTKITAPIDGRTGIRLVDEGNLVQAGDADRHRRDHAGPADRGAVHPAAAAVAAGQQGVREGPARRSRRSAPTASRRSTAARCRWSTTRWIRPPARSAEGRVPQRGPAALAGPVRQCAAAGRDAEAGRRGADRRGAARARTAPSSMSSTPTSTVAVRAVTVGQQDDTQAVIADGVKAGRARGHHRLRAPLERHAGRACSRAKRHAGAAGRRDAAGDAAGDAAREATAQARAARAATASDGKPTRPKRAKPRRDARRAEHQAMNVSAPFIRRPIATSLLGVAVLLGGLLGYLWLPVSALPQVDFPTIQVTTQLPGAIARHHGGAGHGAAGAPVRPDPVARRR